MFEQRATKWKESRRATKLLGGGCDVWDKLLAPLTRALEKIKLGAREKTNGERKSLYSG